MKKRIRLTEGRLHSIIRRCIKEAVGDDEVVSELAEEIGVDVEEVEEVGSGSYGNCREFRCGNMEYIVYDSYDDAYEGAVECNRSLIEDEGSLPNLDLSSFIREDWAEELAREEADYYTDEAVESGEIEEDDRDDYWDKQYNRIVEDPAGYLEGIYGRELGEHLVEYNALDIDAMARECVNVDGVAHFLASYDGNEIDLPSGAVAFRVN